jgi:hypothetical protein
MDLTATEEARRELAALRSRIDDCRRELGLEAAKPVRIQAKHRLRRRSRGTADRRQSAPAA